MTEETTTTSPAPAAGSGTPKKSPKAKVDKKVRKPKAVSKEPSHPKYSVLILEAVTKLNEKGGSSYVAIKKYIAANHHIDVEKNGHFLKKAIRKAVEAGTLSQPKGKGASGSFKLPTKPKAVKKPVAAKPKPKKEKTATSKPKVKKAAPKKVASPQKAAPKKVVKPASPKKPAPKKVTKAKEATSKKVVKKPAAAAKPKTAKVKLPKTTAAAKKSPKKTAAKKK